MANTLIADVIVPELFAPYVIKLTRELSNIITSGIARTDPLLDNMVTKGGKTIDLPFWNPLAGEDEVVSDTDPLTPSKITAGSDVAVKLIRGKAWSANELAGALAGSSPMEAIGMQVAKWWNVQEQKILVAVLKGIFSGPLSTSHTKDISDEAGTAAVISANAVLDTKQLLGDAANQLQAIAMHSAVFTALQKQNLIEYIPNSQGVVNFPTYLGYRIVVDDGLNAVGGVYSTYLFAEGVIARGDGLPTDLTLAEIGRDALAGNDILVNRRALCLHPSGLAWAKPVTTSVTPSNSELATGSNWIKVVEDKAIAIAMLKHKI